MTCTRTHTIAYTQTYMHTPKPYLRNIHKYLQTQVLRFDHSKPNRDVGVGAHFDKIVGANGPEVRVVRLLDRGPAANSGEIHLGDILLTVNDAEVC